MATPNQMPKKPNQIRQQVLHGLIETRPTSWTRKTLSKNEQGKEVVESVKVSHSELKSAFAQNMSDRNVDRLAERWL